jgi:hypothetical protein
MELSVVIPYFGCDSSLDNLCERLHAELRNLYVESEVIFVFDGPGSHWCFFFMMSRLTLAFFFDGDKEGRTNHRLVECMACKAMWL